MLMCHQEYKNSYENHRLASKVEAQVAIIRFLFEIRLKFLLDDPQP